MSNCIAKEFLTFKSGKFVFSCSYDEQVVHPLLAEAKTLHDSVRELPVLPQVADQLRVDIIRRSIFGTAAIEGNPLTEQEVGGLLSSPAIHNEEHSLAQLEIRNLQEAYALLEKTTSTVEPKLLTEDEVKSVHEILTRELEYYHNIPGHYRNEVVMVGDHNHGGVYTPPKILQDIQNLMKEFADWCNKELVTSCDPFIRAVLVHYYLAKIHPFQDGNGRTARFMEALFLKQAGYRYIPELISNYYYRNIDAYFIAFSESQHGDKKDITPFILFFLKGTIESLKSVKSEIVAALRTISLKQHYQAEKAAKRINARQFELLELLVAAPKNFTLLDRCHDPALCLLYKGVSDSTVRRDLKKLTESGFLLFDEETGSYSLNTRQLG